jgi:putative phosphoribosyl transferase
MPRSGGVGPGKSGPKTLRRGDPVRHSRGMMRFEDRDDAQRRLTRRLASFRGDMRVFDDRVDAGRQLAERLESLRGQDVVVLGLPRGGVPVAFEVARALRAPLDVLVVRKLGVPFQPELAFGAIGERGVRVINESVVRQADLSEDEMAAVEAKQRAELTRRVERFRRGRGPISLAGRTAVIVDDGVATGATAKAACQVARAQGASRVILAVPIGGADTAEGFAEYADEVVCLQTPELFFGVGQGYRNFAQTSDDEVVALLGRAREGFREALGAARRTTRRCVMRKSGWPPVLLWWPAIS